MLLLAFNWAGSSGINIPGVGWIGGAGSSTSGTGYYTLPNGTQVPYSSIPTGQLSSQMQLIAINEDGTNQTIFTQGKLPSFKIFGPNGKAVREIDAHAVVAYLSLKPLPSDAMALFKITYTAQIPGLDLARTNQISADVPFVYAGNGSLVLATLPPMNVLAGDVFPEASACASGYQTIRNPNGTTSTMTLPQSACQATSRGVQWTMVANVTVHSPSSAFPSFSLLGSNGASASFNYDGSWGGGCVNCGTGGPTPPAAPIGGVTTSVSGSSNKASLDVPCTNPNGCTGGTNQPSTPPTPPSTETSVNVVSSLSGIEVTGVTSQFGSGTVVTPTSGILTTTTTITVRDRATGKVLSTTTKTTKVGVTTSGQVHSTLNAKSIYGNEMSIIPFDQLRQFEFAGQVYVVNIEWVVMIIMVVGIASLLVVVVVLLSKPKAKHKSKR
jgi:hypothetical protein